MSYKSLRECIDDLECTGQLIRLSEELDPDLEIPEIHRRVYRNKGPAVLYENVKGSPFPAVSNIFGTIQRTHFIFRKTLEDLKRLIKLSTDPLLFISKPWIYKKALITALYSLPKKTRKIPVLRNVTSIEKLPLIRCWPKDGGAFILLPQVYSEDPENPNIINSNIGMYRIQLSGNQYIKNKEIGMHYQIRRDIGIHHSKAVQRKEPLKISIFVGGPPAHTLAAIMPMPQGMSETLIAGLLGKRRFRYTRRQGHVISADADFCITGEIVYGDEKPEGPFGDHLGYYSLTHDFPYIQVESVFHRDNAVWPFTVVGRPPQEDTVFAELIQEITGSRIPADIPGVIAVNTVDAAGVHPLLLAIANERYVPYQERIPREILTAANTILGYGPCSLAKYLFIAAYEDNPDLDIHNIKEFFMHILERTDWIRDIHFTTHTTIDTLDYSGTGLNEGSKIVIAVAGKKKQDLSKRIHFSRLPERFRNPKIGFPGILFIEGPEYTDYKKEKNQMEKFSKSLEKINLKGIALIIIVDDAEFACRNESNFLWTTFTRSNPSHDIYGVKAFIDNKHWGCKGPLIIDARLKPHHAPPLIEDPVITRKVDKLGIKGKPLYGII